MRFKTNLEFHMEGRGNGCEERGSIFFSGWCRTPLTMIFASYKKLMERYVPGRNKRINVYIAGLCPAVDYANNRQAFAFARKEVSYIVFREHILTALRGIFINLCNILYLV